MCEEKVLKGDAVFYNDKTGICKECMACVDAFTEPLTFPGLKKLEFVIAAYPYTGRLRKSFINYKFNSQRAYSSVFSKLLFNAVSKFYKPGDFDIIVPVPLSKQRLNERGYNQAELISEELAKMLGVTHTPAAIFRVRNTPPQSSVAGNARITNVHKAFIADATVVKDKKILLVDDIYTIGSTMEECARELTEKGAKSVAGAVVFKTILSEKQLILQ